MYKLLVLVTVIAYVFAGRDSDGACSSAPCQNGGECANGRLTKNYYCSCPVGFYGRNCENKVKRRCDYGEDLCQNGGECVNSIFFRYYCRCRPGYTGQNCEHTPCDSNPCLNNGHCVNGEGASGGYSCRCAEGWDGNNCEIELPPAAFDCAENNPCSHDNTVANGYYFAHTDKTKFVQCSEWEQCFVMSCGPGTEWDQDHVTCGFPK